MISILLRSCRAACCLGVILLAGRAAGYEVAHLSGGSWSTVYAQGFSTVLGANPNPGLAEGSTVYLQSFEFFKSGSADSAANIRLAILDNIFPGGPDFVTSTTTASPTLVGLSTNTIASTAGIATGDPIVFTFNNLPMSYDSGAGGDYAAVFVNVGADTGSGAPLTPVRVSALTANYVDNGSGTFVPATNYGSDNQFQYATSNFINNNFFSTYSFAADANFRATFSAIPEPTSLGLAIGFVGMVSLYGVYRR